MPSKHDSSSGPAAPCRFSREINHKDTKAQRNSATTGLTPRCRMSLCLCVFVFNFAAIIVCAVMDFCCRFHNQCPFCVEPVFEVITVKAAALYEVVVSEPGNSLSQRLSEGRYRLQAFKANRNTCHYVHVVSSWPQPLQMLFISVNKA